MAYFKCGNVSGNDDSMEWKLVGTARKNEQLNLPTEYKELKIITYSTNNNNGDRVLQKIVGYEELKLVSDSDSISRSAYIVGNSVNSQHFANWTITTNFATNYIQLHTFQLNGSDIKTNSYTYTTVYYR